MSTIVEDDDCAIIAARDGKARSFELTCGLAPHLVILGLWPL